MEVIEVKKGIYWVGGIDWDLRNFHGYLTQRGTTYNAYLIIDEKITLIDTVKHYLVDELLERVSKIVDPAKIDFASLVTWSQSKITVKNKMNGNGIGQFVAKWRIPSTS